MCDKITSKMKPNPNNKIDPKASYIYNHHIASLPEKIGSVHIERCTIVKNVTKQNDGFFHFTIGEEKPIYRCLYGWAFILDTTENREKYSRYLKLEYDIMELNFRKQQIFHEMLTLEGV